MKFEDYFLTEEKYEEYISKKGKTKYLVAKRDKDGNCIKDENGQPILEEKSYILTYEEYKESLWKTMLGMSIDIEDALTSKRENPTSFMIVSPPGAGKSILASYEEAKFEKETSRNLVRLDPDKIGLFHKYHKDIYAEITDNAFPELQKFINTALDDTIRPMVCDSRFDILSEGTFGATESYKEIIKNQINNGYKVIISTIVVPNIERDLSSCERCQKLIENGLPARVVKFGYSKDVEDKFFRTMQQVEQEGLYDEIRVYRRGKDKNSAPILVYTSGDGRYMSAGDAIRDEIHKGERIILNNPEKFQTRIDNLKKTIADDITAERNNGDDSIEEESPKLKQLTFRKMQLDDIQERFDEMLRKKEEQERDDDKI